jgi:hypothetical protein
MLTPCPTLRADCDRDAPMLGVGVYGGNAPTGWAKVLATNLGDVVQGNLAPAAGTGSPKSA